MIKPFLYIVFLVAFASSAQNLVPNGSFEEYSECPTENELGNGQFERCVGWYYSTPMSVGTPDYFNACNNSMSGMVGVPNNFWGYQDAYDGDGYIGLGAYSYSLTTSEVVGKEIVSTRLSSNLKPCTRYRFTMYVSLANKSSHGCSSLGFKLTADDFTSNFLEDYLELNADWESTIIMDDTVNWVRLSNEFISFGGENVLNIGYFSAFVPNNTTLNDSMTIEIFDSWVSYFYIDSVSLIEVGEVENCIPNISNVFTPNNDSYNDVYTIEGLNISEMVILNRWGNVMATLTENYPTWDGTFEGKPCLEGSYFYRAKFGNTYLTGFIELIR